MHLTSSEKKQLRQVAHHLKSIVTLTDTQISEGVHNDTERALKDHELIKIKIALPEKEERQKMAGELATLCNAQVVQLVGKVAVLYRKAKKPNAKLSNLARFGV